MAALQDLIEQIADGDLKIRIQKESNRLLKQKKFGLVFEEHLPECTPLYDLPIKKGSMVSKKNGPVNDIKEVLSICDNTVTCISKASEEIEEIDINDLVCVAQFGEAIYPYLKPVDTVCNAPDNSLWHTLIEADNYHALQLLEYLYADKVDCIYIDPPYNTGAHDWKYNNDYVDSSDSYRHSKWLSMMEKRLKIAKKLLKHDTGVIIVTIDEHEVHHLRTLLEELFPDFYIQMTTDVINPKGVTQGRFSRVEEYNIFCFAQNAFVADSDDNLLNPPEAKKYPRWKGLLRSGTDAQREDRENMFYPVLIDDVAGKVAKVGDSLPLPLIPDVEKKIEGYAVAWPIRKDGSFGRWSVGAETLRELVAKGYVSCGKYDPQRKTWGISYISQPNQKLIDEGKIVITGRDETTGVVTVEYASTENRVVKTVWHRTSHDAGAYGSDIITEIIGQTNSFSFPKSLYAEHDSIASIVRNRKDALIVDFFAGSGTTMHAINLLNYEDGGHRRCILVTNNEVAEADGKSLYDMGIYPGSDEWEEKGICRSVTWPRTKYSILGVHADGTPLQKEYFSSKQVELEIDRSIKQIRVDGNALDVKARKDIISLLGKERLPQSLVKDGQDYIVSEKHPVSILFSEDSVDDWLEALDGQDHVKEIYVLSTNDSQFRRIKTQIIDILGKIKTSKFEKIPMSQGFASNVAYFKLGFLDKTSVSLGKQLAELIPVLWLKAGSIGECPTNDASSLDDYMIWPSNRMAILNDETMFEEFRAECAKYPEIDTVYLVTDYEASYRAMVQMLNGKTTYQLYRDYLDNFRINVGRI